ncbi:MAG: DUF1588 domain-containing protein [Alphaproteobacteria bacterium]|nr:DUF1588 domain-containing protein [Alphaproteobacteria bacterium]
MIRTLPLALALLGACAPEAATGPDDTQADVDSDEPVELPPPEGQDLPLRRLGVREIDRTVRSLLGDLGLTAATWLPEDLRAPFDTVAATQDPSRVLVEGLDAHARAVAAAVRADPVRLAALVACDLADEACLPDLARRLVRALLRHPADDAEVADLVALGREVATIDGAPEAAVEALLSVLLQDPGFVYVIDRGTAVAGAPGVLALDGPSVLTRMALLLWGALPDLALQTEADALDLTDAEVRRGLATRMMTDPRARAHAFDVHVQWLDLHSANNDDPEFAAAVMVEPQRVIERVLFTDARPWQEVLTFPETLLLPGLATAYDFDRPAEPTWVDVRDRGRGGLLGMASWLMRPASVDDTSPTIRGKQVRERIMCEPIDPPPAAVISDAPPDVGLGACKIERYEAHRSNPACASCHDLMDPIGFGLERYDGEGMYRTEEAPYAAQLGDTGAPCPIDGQGEVDGLGAFSGPRELGLLLTEAGIADACFARQVAGLHRGISTLDLDPAEVDPVLTAWRAAGGRYDQLLVELIAQPVFGFREVP